MKRHILLVFIAFLMIFTPTLADSAPRTFQASIRDITPAEQEKMKGRSWLEGCPVKPADLASIHLNYIGYDSVVHEGVLVIHRRLANEVVEIFRELFNTGFQIERMQVYEDFPISQYAASNDTTGFYCRPAQDDPTIFSSHAYGIAIDINPMTNPFLDPVDGWWPDGSAANAERHRVAPGLLTAESEAVKIFLRYGWAWGGMYQKHTDYMHFYKYTVGDEKNPLERPVWAAKLEYVPKP